MGVSGRRASCGPDGGPDGDHGAVRHQVLPVYGRVQGRAGAVQARQRHEGWPFLKLSSEGMSTTDTIIQSRT